MDELLAEFVAETRDMLQAIGGEIVAWEAEPGDRARLDSIFRFIHTVKGNCGFFDYPRLEQLSHAAENALAEVRAGRRQADAALVTAVLAVIDRIAGMIDTIDAGEALPAGGDETLIAQLEDDGTDGGAVAPLPGHPGDPADHRAGQATQRTVRLPVELLDRVMSGVSDLVLARNDLARRLRAAGAEPTIDGPFERLSATLGDLREAVSRMRMQRVEHLFNAFPRLVRDLSAELGKQVMIDIGGTDVELDREMIEMVRDPLTHIVRNAIDHGIETPAERLAAGKREIAMLAMSARQSGNDITLTISDDGRGLDAARIGTKAVAAGLISQAELDAMSRARVLELIFEPGLSTAEQVSAISGRGVGMDVVRSNVERIGGSIAVKSEPGEGTVFFLRLPLTLSIIGGLTIGVGDQRMAIPRSYVDEIAHRRSQAIAFADIGDARLVTFRGERIRYLHLAEILHLGPRREPANVLIIVRLVTGTMFAIGVDEILDHEELVIKPLPPALAMARSYSGLTLLDDGRPLLLLDIPRIAQEFGLIVDDRARIARAAEPVERGASEEARKVMLFTGLDGKQRAMPMELVRRIETVEGGAIEIAPGRAQAIVDGVLLPLAGFAADASTGPNVRLLRLSDGETELVYAVREVADSLALTGAIAPTPGDPTIEGVTVIDGCPVPVVDGHWLFANIAADGSQRTRLRCHLPAGDEWCRTILEPLVRSAGYDVTHGTPQDADLSFIALGEAGAINPAPGQHVIYLRDHRDTRAGTPDSIYRYDREAILAALRAGGRP